MKTLAQIREGLWVNIHAKRKRIKAGSGERMRKPFSKGAPTSDQIKSAQENFQDGRNPQDKGDSARHGIPKKASIAQLMKIRSSKTASPRKKQLAHWQINMRRGKMDEAANTSIGKPDEQTCDNPGPKDKARYWSFKAWSAPTVEQGLNTENYVVEQLARKYIKEFNDIHKNNKLKDLTTKEKQLFHDYKHADFEDKSLKNTNAIQNYKPESALLNGFLKHHYDNSYEGTRYSHPDQNPSNKIKAMDDVLHRHKTDREMSVYTGIRNAPKTDGNGLAHLPGYTSTSLSPYVAIDFAREKTESDKETHTLNITLPAGSHAVSLHHVGGKDREHEHEHEILMGRGHTIKIHPVPRIVEDFGGTKHHIWHAEVVKHEPKNIMENYNSKLLTLKNKSTASEKKIPMLDTFFGNR